MCTRFFEHRQAALRASGPNSKAMINPESRGHRSYYESFVRHHNITPDVLSEEKALTDRGAYLNFLEIQLERVSAACLAGQECSATVDSMSSKISSIDAKVGKS